MGLKQSEPGCPLWHVGSVFFVSDPAQFPCSNPGGIAHSSSVVHVSPIGMRLKSVGPVAPFGPLATFFVFFPFREAAAAAAGTKQLELVAAARAARAKTEIFMVVGYVVL